MPFTPNKSMTKLLPVIALSLLITACGGGLSAKEKRAAEAHANNLCQLMKDPYMDDFAKSLVGLTDIASVSSGPDTPESRVIEEGTRIARQRGCVS